MHLEGAPGPLPLVRHTSLMICSRRKTTPGRWASRASRSNSLRVSGTTAPSTLTRRVGRSMRMEPIRSSASPLLGVSSWTVRRLTAWIRASSSPVS